MHSTLCAILDSIVDAFSSFSKAIGPDVLFFIALAVEALFVVYFLVKSIFSYEASLNRALEKINYWLFEKKVVTEENIKELNFLFKTRAPKRLCYYWQQYILFREGAPSSYLSTENLIEKPLKTSSYTSNIKNLTIISTIWGFVTALFAMIATGDIDYIDVLTVFQGLLAPIFVAIIAVVFIIYLRYRRNSILNSLYQNISVFGRFMDNACIDLPSYIDYQILFTPQEIENGQPVLREFLDYKARKEKEEFNRAKEENVQLETYDFSATGIDGSIVLDRAMKESELFLKKKEKILLKISQLETELDSRRKNFDNVQKDYQTKIQASKENIDRLRQMQEETTNRIESNYYRKQQTQEIAKQEQYEQEFEQQRAKYMLEKNEGEEEISKMKAELDLDRHEVELAMISEYQTFFDKFCKSAEKVVGKVFSDKISSLKDDNEKKTQHITELEIKLKNTPQADMESEQDGQYDDQGNYVFSNGTYYDQEGNFHASNGDVYSQDGKLLSKAKPKEEEKKIVDFDNFDAFDFVTDISQKGDVFDVAEKVVKDVDENVEVVNNSEPTKFETAAETTSQKPEEEKEPESAQQPAQEKKEEQEVLALPETQTPKRKAGRPKKTVQTDSQKPARKVGRPRKEKQEAAAPKRRVGRPRKIVKAEQTEQPKKSRGRPRKDSNISEINQKLSAEQERLKQMRQSVSTDLENALSDLNANTVDEKNSKRANLIKEIEALQKEAEQVIAKNDTAQMEQINQRLEELLKQVEQLG